MNYVAISGVNNNMLYVVDHAHAMKRWSTSRV